MNISSRIRVIISILATITICTSSFALPSHAKVFVEELQQNVKPEISANGVPCDSLSGNQASERLQEVDEETAAKFSNLVSSASFAEFSTQITQDFPQVFQPQIGQIAHFAYGDKISMVIPIEGGAGYSYYAEWYQLESATLLGSVASLFTETAAGNIAAKLYVDSQLIFDAVVTPQGKFIEAYSVKNGEYVEFTLSDQQEPVSSWWSCFLTCLSNHDDVPGWVSALISTACGIICLVGPSWACHGCIILLPLVVYFPAIWRCWGNCLPSTIYLPMVQKEVVTVTTQ